MSKLSARIIACGLCHNFGEADTNYITEDQANKIINVCKDEFIAAIEDIHPFASGSNESTSMQQAAIEAIKAVK